MSAIVCSSQRRTIIAFLRGFRKKLFPDFEAAHNGVVGDGERNAGGYPRGRTCGADSPEAPERRERKRRNRARDKLKNPAHQRPKSLPDALQHISVNKKQKQNTCYDISSVDIGAVFVILDNLKNYSYHSHEKADDLMPVPFCEALNGIGNKGDNIYHHGKDYGDKGVYEHSA